MLHEKYKPPSSRQQPSSEALAFRQSLQEVAEQNKDMKPHIGKAQVECMVTNLIFVDFKCFVESLMN